MNIQMDSRDYRLVGLRIRSCREAKNISQEQLANKAGLATGTIGKIERGINNPKTDTLLRIAHELDVPCKLFFEKIDCEKPTFSSQTQRLLKYMNYLSETEIGALCTIAKIMADTRLNTSR